MIYRRIKSQHIGRKWQKCYTSSQVKIVKVIKFEKKKKHKIKTPHLAPPPKLPTYCIKLPMYCIKLLMFHKKLLTVYKLFKIIFYEA